MLFQPIPFVLNVGPTKFNIGSRAQENVIICGFGVYILRFLFRIPGLIFSFCCFIYKFVWINRSVKDYSQSEKVLAFRFVCHSEKKTKHLKNLTKHYSMGRRPKKGKKCFLNVLELV